METIEFLAVKAMKMCRTEANFCSVSHVGQLEIIFPAQVSQRNGKKEKNFIIIKEKLYSFLSSLWLIKNALLPFIFKFS